MATGYVQRVVAGIQAKLKVGQPCDIYEQEVAQVAEPPVFGMGLWVTRCEQSSDYQWPVRF